MKVPELFKNLKPLAITYISVIAFSNFVFVLFSQTVRDIIWSFFKMTGETFILGIVFLFAFAFFMLNSQAVSGENFAPVDMYISGGSAGQ